MNISTEFNIDDKVFFIKDGKIKQAFVHSFEVNKSGQRYCLKGDETFYFIDEPEAFKSADAVITSLMGDCEMCEKV